MDQRKIGREFDLLLTYSRVWKLLFPVMMTLLVPKYSALYGLSVPGVGVFSVGILWEKKV